MSLDPIVIQGMFGLGDNIYQRPFVAAASRHRDVYLVTPWPEIYEGLRVKFVKQETKLRTQAKNMQRQTTTRWCTPPRLAKTIRNSYSPLDLAKGSILSAMGRKLSLYDEPLNMTLEAPSIHKAAQTWREYYSSRPIAVVRPVTLRTEWHNMARNPLPIYVSRAAQILTKTHLVISVADLQEGAEHVLTPEPPAHYYFHKGELDVVDLLGLCAAANVIVGGVGWIVPASIALRKRAFIILGGQGAHNGPRVITDPRVPHQITFATPDKFCKCATMRHDCNKVISNFDEQLDNFICTNFSKPSPTTN